MNLRLLPFGHHDGYDVEPGFSFELFDPDVFVCCPDQELLFVAVDEHFWLSLVI